MVARVARVVAVIGLVLGCGGRPVPTSAPEASIEVAAAPAAPPRPPALSEESIVADLTWLTEPARRGRGSRSPEARDVARWIERELTAAGYAPIIQPIDQVPGQVNVIAVHGATATGATVVVSAHYDHLGEIDGVVYPGADDNASGVAVALAVARDVAARRAITGRVVFVFTGAEEIGLYGAIAYADAPVHPLAETRLVINLDMVGRRLFESALDKDAALGVIGLDGDLATTAAEIGVTAGLELMTATPGMVRLIGQDWRSDDWVFRDRGMRAVHLSTGLHDDYHRATDSLDRLSRAQLVKIARFLDELVIATAK
jgi:Zn-dependent M28 family amino/carboxypeptidase